ncbi:hypothetical protein IB238_04070 [Rhizobium sp. ARZ01]|uniref:hypothetical protein n=1 Tax=Rhizobium sp. ARZ01 TaxID=2769313 RepID=UPI0017826B83|nr:hypothetical protein [Rhizobium sp. ARZ01]MBD9371816.1 hypothetical protein [Rhizobium sp. ARZ01]
MAFSQISMVIALTGGLATGCASATTQFAATSNNVGYGPNPTLPVADDVGNIIWRVSRQR